jgi:hypothetical protein
MAAGDLWGEAVQLFDDVVQRLDSPPKRRYISEGAPAFDCEQLVLHVSRLTPGVTTRGLTSPTQATATFTRLWCAPTSDARGNPPTAQALHTSAGIVVGGGWELWQAVMRAVEAHNCRPAVVEAVTVGPEGGFSGWQVTVQWTP